MNAIWIEVWGALTPASKSKGRAPNHMQLVEYVKVFRSYMGKHRDNTTQLDMKGMIEGKEIDFEKVLCGIPSSQVLRSKVIVYITGNRPMEMKFSYPAIQDNIRLLKAKGATIFPAKNGQFRPIHRWKALVMAFSKILLLH